MEGICVQLDFVVYLKFGVLVKLQPEGTDTFSCEWVKNNVKNF